MLPKTYTVDVIYTVKVQASCAYEAEQENSYFRIVHGREWKVELLGIKTVIYL